MRALKLSCMGSHRLLLLLGGGLGVLDLKFLLFCVELGSPCGACYYLGPSVDLAPFGGWPFGGIHQFAQVSILDGSKCGVRLCGRGLYLCGTHLKQQYLHCKVFTFGGRRRAGNGGMGGTMAAKGGQH